MITNHEAVHYAVFSGLLSPSLSLDQISAPAPYSRTPSDFVTDQVPHPFKTAGINYSSLYLISVFFTWLVETTATAFFPPLRFSVYKPVRCLCVLLRPSSPRTRVLAAAHS
jgi:hypothetical protein